MSDSQLMGFSPKGEIKTGLIYDKGNVGYKEYSLYVSLVDNNRAEVNDKKSWSVMIDGSKIATALQEIERINSSYHTLSNNLTELYNRYAQKEHEYADTFNKNEQARQTDWYNQMMEDHAQYLKATLFNYSDFTPEQLDRLTAKSPKIDISSDNSNNRTWWTWDYKANNYQGGYVDTKFKVNLTKEEVEHVLTGNITTHTHNQYLTINNAANTYATITSLNEEITRAKNAEKELKASININAGYISNNTLAISNEAKRATAKEDELNESIRQLLGIVEQNERANGEAHSSLNQFIKDETTRAKQEENNIKGTLSTETTNRQNADNALKAIINSETLRAQQAEKTNTDSITNIHNILSNRLVYKEI